jgi:hypothetical protein
MLCRSCTVTWGISPHQVKRLRVRNGPEPPPAVFSFSSDDLGDFARLQPKQNRYSPLGEHGHGFNVRKVGANNPPPNRTHGFHSVPDGNVVPPCSGMVGHLYDPAKCLSAHDWRGGIVCGHLQPCSAPSVTRQQHKNAQFRPVVIAEHVEGIAGSLQKASREPANTFASPIAGQRRFNPSSASIYRWPCRRTGLGQP